MKQIIKRSLSWLLTFCMVLSLLPITSMEVKAEPTHSELKETIENAGFSAEYSEGDTVLTVTGNQNGKKLELTIPAGITVNWQATLTGGSGGDAVKILADSDATSVFRVNGIIGAGSGGYGVYNAGPGSIVVATGGSVSGGSGSPCGGIYAEAAAGNITVETGATVSGGTGATTYAINTASDYNGSVNVNGNISLGTGATNNYGIYMTGTGTGTLTMSGAQILGDALYVQAVSLTNQSQNHRIENSTITCGTVDVINSLVRQNSPAAIALGADAGLTLAGSTVDTAGPKGITSAGTLHVMDGSIIYAKGDGGDNQTDKWCVLITGGTTTYTDSQAICWYGNCFRNNGGSYSLKGNTALLQRAVTETPPADIDANVVQCTTACFLNQVYTVTEESATNLYGDPALVKWMINEAGKEGVYYELNDNIGFIDYSEKVSITPWYAVLTDAGFSTSWNEGKTVLTVTGNRTGVAPLSLGIPKDVTVDWQAVMTSSASNDAAITLSGTTEASAVFKVSGTGSITGGSGANNYAILNNGKATIEVSNGGKVKGGSGTNSYGIKQMDGTSSTIIVDNGTVEAGTGSTSSTAIHIPINTTTLLTIINGSVINGGTGTNSTGILYGSTNVNSVIQDSTLLEGGKGTANGAALYLAKNETAKPVLTITDSVINTAGDTGIRNAGIITVENCRIDVKGASAMGIRNVTSTTASATITDSQVVAVKSTPFQGESGTTMRLIGKTVGVGTSKPNTNYVTRDSDVITFTWAVADTTGKTYSVGTNTDLNHASFPPEPSTTVLKWNGDTQGNSGISYAYGENVGFLNMEVYGVNVPTIAKTIKSAGFDVSWNEAGDTLTVTGEKTNASTLTLTIPDGVTIDWQAEMAVVSGNAIVIAADSAADGVFKVSNGGSITAGSDGSGILSNANGVVIEVGENGTVSGGSGSYSAGIDIYATVTATVIIDRGTVNGGSGSGQSSALSLSSKTTLTMNGATIHGGSGATSYGVENYNPSTSTRIENSTITAGNGTGYALYNAEDCTLEVINCTIIAQGNQGIGNIGTMLLDTSTLYVLGDDGIISTHGIYNEGTMTVQDSISIVRYGIAYQNVGTLDLMGNSVGLGAADSSYSTMDEDVILIKWTGADETEYTAAGKADLTVNPSTAAVKWDFGTENESGISYEKGSNIGFIDLDDYVVVSTLKSTIERAGFTTSWDAAKTTLTVTGTANVTPTATLKLSIPDGITVDWQAELTAASGAAIELKADSAANSVFRVSNGGNITGGNASMPTTNYGIYNKGTGTVEVNEDGVVNGGTGVYNMGIAMLEHVSGKIIVNKGTVNGGSGTATVGIYIPDGTTLLTVIDGTINAGSGMINFAIGNGSSNANNKISENSIIKSEVETQTYIIQNGEGCKLTIENSTVITQSTGAISNEGTLLVDGCEITVVGTSELPLPLIGIYTCDGATTVKDSVVIVRGGQAFDDEDGDGELHLTGNTFGFGCDASSYTDAAADVILVKWSGADETEYIDGTKTDLTITPVGATAKWTQDESGKAGLSYEKGSNTGFINLADYMTITSIIITLRDAGFNVSENEDKSVLTVTNKDGVVPTGNLKLSIPDGVTIDWQAELNTTSGNAIEINADSAADSVFKVSNGGSITGGDNNGIGILSKASGVTIEVDENSTVSGGSGANPIGIYIDQGVSGAVIIIDGGTVIGGTATDGPTAICTNRSTATKLIIKNGAVINGGSAPDDKWSYAIEYASSNENSIITDSTLIGMGSGYALYYEGSDSLTIRNCELIGGIENEESPLNIDNCTITRNSSSGYALISYKGSVTVNDSIVIARNGAPFKNYIVAGGTLNLTGNTVGLGKQDNVNITSKTDDVILIKWSGADETEYAAGSDGDLTADPSEATVKWALGSNNESGVSYTLGSNTGFLDLDDYVLVSTLKSTIERAGFNVSESEDKTVLTVTNKEGVTPTGNLILSIPEGITVDWQAELSVTTGAAIVIAADSAADSVFKVSSGGSITGGDSSGSGILSKANGVTIEVCENATVTGGSGFSSMGIRIYDGISGTVIIDGGTVNGGTGTNYSTAIYIPQHTTTCLIVKNHADIDGGSANTSYGIDCYSTNENSIIEDSTITAGKGSGYVICYEGTEELLIRNCEINAQGNEGVLIINGYTTASVESYAKIENCTITVAGNSSSAYGISTEGTTIVKDSIVIARYGKAFDNDGGTLTLTGKTVGFEKASSSYTSKTDDVILVEWSGADETEYNEGTELDLTVTPSTATVKWKEALDGKAGISYEQGANTGFINLEAYMTINSILKVVKNAGFNASWNDVTKTVLTVTNKDEVVPTGNLTLSIPEGVTIDWQAEMAAANGTAIKINSDSAADSIFKVRNGGSITGGTSGSGESAGIQNDSDGTVRVDAEGMVCGGSGGTAVAILQTQGTSGKIIINQGTVNGGSGNTTIAISIKQSDALLSITGGTINGGSGTTSYGILNGSNNENNIITGNSTVIGGKGTTAAIVTINNAKLVIENSTITGIGGAIVDNNGTMKIDNCVLENTNDGSGNGVQNTAGTITVKDSVVIARYGKAFENSGGQLYPTGTTTGFGSVNSGYSMLLGDAIIIKWTGTDEAEYKEGMNTDLTVQPIDATISWRYNGAGKAGVAYEKGTNSGFINLSTYDVTVISIESILVDAGFDVSWNEAKTVLTVTGTADPSPASTLTLRIPDGITVNWQATLIADEGAAIVIDVDSAATGVFEVSDGSITGGENDGDDRSYGILNKGAGTIKVTGGTVNGGNGTTSYGIYDESEADVIISMTSGTINGGNGTASFGIYIPAESTTALVTTGGTIDGGAGNPSNGIYLGSSNATNKIEKTTVTGGTGNGFAIRMTAENSVLEIKESTITGLGARGVYNEKGTLTVNKSTIIVSGSTGSPYGIAGVDCDTTVTDSTVIVRYGTAFVQNGGTLNLNGNTVVLESQSSAYTNKESDVVMIRWTGDDEDEYLEGNKDNLTVVPAGAAAWSVQNGKSGIYYSKGDNQGFIDLSNYVVVIKMYTITYSGNGSTSGTVPSTSGTKYRTGTSVTVSGNTGSLAKTGYNFAGWNTKANGTGTNYAAGASFNIGADTTLYAKWTQNYVAVTNITGVPTAGKVGTTLTLAGTAAPSNASQKTITWSIVSKGSTGAKLNGKKLTFTNAGTVKVRATIKDGVAKGTDYKKDFTIRVKFNVTKGKTYTVSGLNYKATLVDNSGKKGVEVSVTGLAKNNKNAKTVTVPKTVKIKGATCKVTSIGDKAFKNNTKLKKITIGDNVKTIGISAFIYCTSLEIVSIGTGLTEIKTHAFCYDKKIKTFTIKSKNLKKIGAPHTFNQVKGTVKVPSSKLSAYKKLFKNQKGTEGIKFKKI